MTFIALNIPIAGFPDQPISVNSAHVRTIMPRWTRRPGGNGAGEASHDLAGTWVCVGGGEEGTFPVTQSYHEVQEMLRHAGDDFLPF